jgi:hypothetical protein
VTRLQAARELIRLTTVLEEAIGLGDVGAADRLLEARGRVLAEATMDPMTASETEALDAAVREYRDLERRVRASLGRAIHDTRTGLATIAASATATRAYIPGKDRSSRFVDRRD